MDIRIVNIAKDFGNTGALRGVSLTIQHGELIALLGPSGSGKTTLLRIIAGLEMAKSGQVFFGDEDATHLSVQDRRIGFVFQNYALFRHMTVADNIAYGLRVRPRGERPSAPAIKAKVEELLTLMQIADKGGRYPAQLSGGQQQRVALARALAVEPRVLLLDEPFGALDAKVRKDLRRWLRALHESTGHTTIFVTHDQEEALELADRVAILNDGMLEQIGSADEIDANPASPFVMGFIGDTTNLPVTKQNGVLMHGDRKVEGPFTGCIAGAGHLYVRPGDIDVVTADTTALTGTVTHVHRRPAGRHAQVALDSTHAVIEIDLPADTAIHTGEKVGLRFRKGRLFPA